MFRASSWPGDTLDASMMIIKREPKDDRDQKAPYDLIKGSNGVRTETIAQAPSRVKIQGTYKDESGYKVLGNQDVVKG